MQNFKRERRRGVLYEYIRGDRFADAGREKDGERGEKKFKGFDNSSPAPEFDLILFQFSVIDG